MKTICSLFYFLLQKYIIDKHLIKLSIETRPKTNTYHDIIY